MRSSCRVTIATGLHLLGLSVARLPAEEWVLGGQSGTLWDAVARSAAQIDGQTAPGAIQIRGFSPDQNIITTLNWNYGRPADLTREGGAALWDNTAFRNPISLAIVDGDSTTSTENQFKAAGQDQDGRVFVFDLGSRVPAARLRFFPRQTGADASGRLYGEAFIRKFEIQVSDGLSYADAQPVFQLLHDVPVNPNSVVDLSFAPQFIRFIRLRVGSRNPFEIAEFQLFGDGFVPRAFYESDVVNLGEVSNYGRIWWPQQTLRREQGALVAAGEPATAVAVRMRTGRDDSPQVFFRRAEDPETREVSLEEVSEEEYRSLPKEEQSPRLDDDVENWSPWSQPLVSGQQLLLPSPRPFFQLQIILESQSVQQTVRLDSLVIEHSVPPAALVEGEISIAGEPNPPRGIVSVDGGVRVLFAYDVRARLEPGQTGFDALRITAPTPLVFRGLLMGEPLAPVTPDSVKAADEALEVFFTSNKVEPGNAVPLRVLFEGSVAIFNTIFSGRVWDTQSGLLGQPVLEGDANPEVSTNTLRVALTRESIGQILRNVKLEPAVFTPNGDGVNDQLRLEYTITQLSAPRQVEVAVFDLSGLLVRKLVEEERRGGIYRAFWDGRDERGKLVAPGIYVVLVGVNTRAGSFRTSKAIGIIH
ncbi:MAG: gliding motility-associated C-terminal domain-containing protein [Candidatus Latescibacteria bacterium]|nr:gliding motility-associated C-terminal domain-containing protein [Candidatus Latescibacterota bacterium]